MNGQDLTFWLAPWEPSPLLWLVFGAAAIVCHPPPRVLPQICFWSGLALLWAALQTGLDYFAEHLFWVHRLQHLALHHAGPLLIIIARPQIRRPAWLTLILRRLKWLNHPVAAPLIFSGLIAIWLVPSIHAVAMLDVHLYHLMNWTMAINGLMFWQAVLLGGASPFVRMAMTAAVMPIQIILGLMLVSASVDLYPIYALCGRPGALTPLADQQLGGLILWWPGAMMSVLVCAWIAHRSVSGSFPARRTSQDGIT
ncbi:cytochrome c oxidase assembly protein [Asticcacaulis taihuensis]|uniref:cytochrome c oxidase assembly protein n=1 Tax=Asticcacaulis taihuensis TaxID=260084 RepID=UPI0026ED5032|nr:cytochrome c oxidase assembly protein [Asticcacaulis taihuensis]